MASKPHPDDYQGGNKIIRHYNRDKTFLDLSVDQTIARGLNRWQGWRCGAGSLYLYVGFDGDVYAGNCRVGGKLGNVYGEFELPSKWITCTNEFCGCGGDLLVPKVKSDSYKEFLANTLSEINWESSRRTDSIQTQVAVETAFPFTGVRIQWDIGRRCNYSCSYCWPDVHSATEPLKSYEVLRSATQKLLDEFSRGRKVTFQFGGGEPTLYPKFLELVQELKSAGHDVVLTSNGSRHHTYWSEMIKYASVNISVHFESANLDKLYRNFETMIAAREQDPNCGYLEVKLMVPPGTVERAKDFRERIIEIPNFRKHAAWSLVPIRHPIIDKKLAATLVEYDPRELEILQEN